MSAFGLATVVIDGSPTLVASDGNSAYPVPRLVDDGPQTFVEALEDWEKWTDAIEEALAGPSAAGHAIDVDEVEYLALGLDRPSVWCAGGNYSDHLAEMGVKAEGIRAYHFLSPATTLNHHRGVVSRPVGANQLDWEVELVGVVGRRARHVSAADALTYIAGYTVANDVSVRDPDTSRHPFFGMDWTSSKNGDGLTPIGPAIVPARFVPDPGNLDISLTVNGNVRQKSSTSFMIVSLAEQIEALSALVTLLPGDVILTGTPAGTAAAHGGAFLQDGDVMVAAIAGLSSLENTVGPTDAATEGSSHGR